MLDKEEMKQIKEIFKDSPLWIQLYNDEENQISLEKDQIHDRIKITYNELIFPFKDKYAFKAFLGFCNEAIEQLMKSKKGTLAQREKFSIFDFDDGRIMIRMFENIQWFFTKKVFINMIKDFENISLHDFNPMDTCNGIQSKSEVEHE